MGTLPYVYSDRRVSLVEQYGAVGNGVADDTAKIQAAIDTGLPVRLQPGKNYLITDTINLDNAGQVLDGGGATITQGFATSVESPMILASANRTEIQNLQIVGTETEGGFSSVSTNYNKAGIRVTGSDVRIDNVTISGKLCGIRVENVRCSINSCSITGVLTSYQLSNFHPGILVDESAEYPTITSCRIQNIGPGITFGDTVEYGIIDGCAISNFFDNGIYVSSGRRCVVSNNTLRNGRGTGIKCRGPGMAVVGNSLYDIVNGSGINITGVFVADAEASEFQSKLIWFAAGSTEPKINETITGATSGATGQVVKVYQTGGVWSLGTATGYLHIKNEVGTFSTMEAIEVGTPSVTTVSIDSIDDSTDTINATAHGLSNGDSGSLLSSTGVTPLRLDPGRYYVVNATTNSFQLANSSGGTAIDIESVPAATFTFIKDAQMIKASGTPLNSQGGHGAAVVGNTVENTTYYGISLTDLFGTAAYGVFASTVTGNTVRNCGQSSGFSAVLIEGLDTTFVGNQIFDYEGDTAAFETYFNSADTAGLYPKGLLLADCHIDGGASVGARIRTSPGAKLTGSTIVGESASVQMLSPDFLVANCTLNGEVQITYPEGEFVDNDISPSVAMDTTTGSYKRFRFSGNRIFGKWQWRPSADTHLDWLDFSNNRIENNIDACIQVIPFLTTSTGITIGLVTFTDNYSYCTTADKTPLEFIQNSPARISVDRFVVRGGFYNQENATFGDVDFCLVIQTTVGTGTFHMDGVRIAPGDSAAINSNYRLAFVDGFESQTWINNDLGSYGNRLRLACYANCQGPLIAEQNKVWNLKGNGGIEAGTDVTSYWYRNNLIMKNYDSGNASGPPLIGGADTLFDGANLYLTERTADPADPAEGQSVIWQSDGTGSGDAGDIMVKITEASTTKTVTLIDYSAS